MKTLYFVALAIAAPAMAQSTGGAGAVTTGAQPRPGVNENGEAFRNASQGTQTQTLAPERRRTDTSQVPTTSTTTGKTPVGGYQPASQPTTTPGATVVFQPSRPVSEMYPAPAPLDSYPICKKGQTDKCRQRGG